MCAQVERNLQDAMGVARNVMLDPRLVPGGGAVEMAISRGLLDRSASLQGAEQVRMLHLCMPAAPVLTSTPCRLGSALECPLSWTCWDASAGRPHGAFMILHATCLLFSLPHAGRRCMPHLSCPIHYAYSCCPEGFACQSAQVLTASVCGSRQGGISVGRQRPACGQTFGCCADKE